MAFFKILSDDPNDFPIDDHDFHINPAEEENCLELILDTGETYIIPVGLLISIVKEMELQCHCLTCKVH